MIAYRIAARSEQYSHSMNGGGPPDELNPIGNGNPYRSKPLVLPAERFCRGVIGYRGLRCELCFPVSIAADSLLRHAALALIGIGLLGVLIGAIRAVRAP